MRMAWSMLAVGLVLGCGPRAAAPPVEEPMEERRGGDLSEDPEPSSWPIGSEHDAIARFEEVFAHLLADGGGPGYAIVADMEKARDWGQAAGPGARETTCGESATLLRNSLGADRSPVIAGSVEASEEAQAAGRTCWTVSLAVGFRSLLVVLAADNGELLFAWLPPEG